MSKEKVIQFIEHLEQKVKELQEEDNVEATHFHNECLKMRKDLQRLEQENEELGGRVNNCRDYLMQVEPDDLKVGDCLVALGYNENGH